MHRLPKEVQMLVDSLFHQLIFQLFQYFQTQLTGCCPHFHFHLDRLSDNRKNCCQCCSCCHGLRGTNVHENGDNDNELDCNKSTLSSDNLLIGHDDP